MKRLWFVKILGVVLLCAVVVFVQVHYWEAADKFGLPFYEVIVFGFFILVLIYSKINTGFYDREKLKLDRINKLFLIKLISATVLYNCSNSGIPETICSFLAFVDSIFQAIFILLIIDLIWEVVINIDL